MPNAMNQPLPVTVLAGLPGVGKTTLLDHLLAQHGGVSIAVVRGRIDDLSGAINSAAAEGRFDAIVVEASGTDDPQVISESMVFDNDIAHLDTVVTVVDAESFSREYTSTDSLNERGIAVDDHDDRTVVEVLISQIEFCDVIVINKTDLVDTDALANLRSILHALNPRAELIDAHQGAVTASELVNTDRFDFDATSSAPGWLAMLNADPDTPSEFDDPDIGGFVYRARRPFHPERL
jgi:G3E family GTPase